MKLIAIAATAFFAFSPVAQSTSPVTVGYDSQGRLNFISFDETVLTDADRSAAIGHCEFLLNAPINGAAFCWTGITIPFFGDHRYFTLNILDSNGHVSDVIRFSDESPPTPEFPFVSLGILFVTTAPGIPFVDSVAAGGVAIGPILETPGWHDLSGPQLFDVPFPILFRASIPEPNVLPLLVLAWLGSFGVARRNLKRAVAAP